jgi:hypothetical protein
MRSAQQSPAPASADEVDRLVKLATPAALERLVAIMNARGTNAIVRVRAAEAVLDLGHGRQSSTCGVHHVGEGRGERGEGQRQQARQGNGLGLGRMITRGRTTIGVGWASGRKKDHGRSRGGGNGGMWHSWHPPLIRWNGGTAAPQVGQAMRPDPATRPGS